MSSFVQNIVDKSAIIICLVSYDSHIFSPLYFMQGSKCSLEVCKTTNPSRKMCHCILWFHSCIFLFIYMVLTFEVQADFVRDADVKLKTESKH